MTDPESRRRAIMDRVAAAMVADLRRQFKGKWFQEYDGYYLSLDGDIDVHELLTATLAALKAEGIVPSEGKE